MKPLTITDEMTEAALVKWFKSETTWYAGMAPWSADQFRAEMKATLEAALSTLPIAGDGKVAAPINWDDANDPAVKLFVGYDVEGYVEEYEFCGDEGYYHTPNDDEKSLISDAIYGVVADIHEKLRALIPSSPGKDGGQEVGAVGYRWKLHKDSPWGYGSSARNDAYVCEPVYARPASTALVERQMKALEPFATTPYASVSEDIHDDHEICAGITVGDLREARAALSASTSREGER